MNDESVGALKPSHNYQPSLNTGKPVVTDSPVAILQEHIAFLREQLAAKRYWYEEALTHERQRAEKAVAELEVVRKDRERLRMMAVEMRQIHIDNCTPGDDDYKRWSDILDF